MQVCRRDTEYAELVAAWRAIIAVRLPDAETQTACLKLLQQFIDRLASSALRSQTPTLQLYANMCYLGWLSAPRVASDEFGQKVIMPAWWFVRDWIQANRFAR